MAKAAPSRHKVRFLLVLVALVIGYGWAIRGLDLDSGLPREVLPNLLDFLSRLWPPDFSESVLSIAGSSLVETIQMSLIGTTLGALISAPLAVASAWNLSPRWVRILSNGIQNGVRAVPSIVYGLLFVAATGLGAQAGVLALSLYSVGYLAKFYQEAMEGVDPLVLDAFTLIGASRLQKAQYAVLPQVLPLCLGYTFYLFEYNIRAASILGVVGAGGIGFELVSYIRGFEYSKATTIMLVLLAMVSLIDGISARLRRRLERP